MQKKTKKKQKFLAFLNANYSKTNLIKALNSIDASRTNGRLVQNPKKKEALGNYFCLKRISKFALL